MFRNRPQTCQNGPNVQRWGFQNVRKRPKRLKHLIFVQAIPRGDSSARPSLRWLPPQPRVRRDALHCGTAAKKKAFCFVLIKVIFSEYLLRPPDFEIIQNLWILNWLHIEWPCLASVFIWPCEKNLFCKSYQNTTTNVSAAIFTTLSFFCPCISISSVGCLLVQLFLNGS